LTHLASRRSLAAGARPYSRGALAGWLADPQSLKPGNHMPYVATNPDELNALVDYLDSLK
ncbi:MAG: cytochrome C oxidase subunit II, partial [Caulobacter sp.]|nr:cytochrome C oxidase subunit II [Caulobacter sp.]